MVLIVCSIARMYAPLSCRNSCTWSRPALSYPCWLPLRHASIWPMAFRHPPQSRPRADITLDSAGLRLSTMGTTVTWSMWRLVGLYTCLLSTTTARIVVSAGTT